MMGQIREFKQQKYGGLHQQSKKDFRRNLRVGWKANLETVRIFTGYSH